MMQITREQFELILSHMRVMAQTVPAIFEGLPLAEFAQDCRSMDTLGPVLDPSLWMKSGQKHNHLADLAEAHVKFIAALEKAKPQFTPASATPAGSESVRGSAHLTSDQR